MGGGAIGKPLLASAEVKSLAQQFPNGQKETAPLAHPNYAHSSLFSAPEGPGRSESPGRLRRGEIPCTTIPQWSIGNPHLLPIPITHIVLDFLHPKGGGATGKPLLASAEAKPLA